MTAPHTPARVAVLGGSGLVGRALIAQLLADPAIQSIHLLLRRPPSPVPTDPRITIHLTDFRDDHWQPLMAVDTVFCCLGTTIKSAGSPAAFRAVDQTLVVDAARAAQQQGAKHVLVISALGADPHSRVFYNRVKGEMEQALQQLGLTRLSLFRPSLLSGPRQHFRLGERLGLLVAWLLPRRWRAISDRQVARAMWRASREQQEPVRVYSSAEMQTM